MNTQRDTEYSTGDPYPTRLTEERFVERVDPVLRSERTEDAPVRREAAAFVGSDEVCTIFRLDTHSVIFHRLDEDTRLAGVAGFPPGDDVYVHQSRLNFRPGFTGKGFCWHPDFETGHAEDRMPRPPHLARRDAPRAIRPHGGPLA